ncbi:MAG: hypothetical protein V8T46_02855 [Sutterella seckii]
MACDEVFYRQIDGRTKMRGWILMKKYGDPLTLYIDGYLHDVHEAEELMLDVFADRLRKDDGASESAPATIPMRPNIAKAVDTNLSAGSTFAFLAGSGAGD